MSARKPVVDTSAYPHPTRRVRASRAQNSRAHEQSRVDRAANIDAFGVRAVPESKDLLLARACLQRLQRILPGGVHGLIEQHGPEQTLRRLRDEHPTTPHADGQESSIEACIARATADLDAADRLGIRLLVPEHSTWPARLSSYRLARPAHPIALWVRGNPDLGTLTRSAVTVLAEPLCGAYGIEVADLFGYRLAQHGATLISDTGRGVAAALHRSAIRASSGAANIAVLPCGPERIYPADAMDILEQVADHGAIVSCRPPGTPPHPSIATEAAVLAASLSAVTVLVQANPDSPLLDLARTLATHTRLLVVPGPITARGSAGPHQLLREHLAQPATSAAEVTEALRHHGCDT